MTFAAGAKLRANELEAIRRTIPTAATVATSETTATTSYTDLATVGPAVTVETGASALVTVTSTFSNSGGNHSYMGFTISGATTVAAADTSALFGAFASATPIRCSATFLVEGLTPGSNTFTAKYRAGAGTGTWVNRNIIVQPA